MLSKVMKAPVVIFVCVVFLGNIVRAVHFSVFPRSPTCAEATAALIVANSNTLRRVRAVIVHFLQVPFIPTTGRFAAPGVVAGASWHARDPRSLFRVAHSAFWIAPI